jgi:hypothetical protein
VTHAPTARLAAVISLAKTKSFRRKTPASTGVNGECAIMTADEIAKNLLTGKTCDTCFHGAGLDCCSYEADLARDDIIRKMLKDRVSAPSEEEWRTSGMNANFSSLKKPYPVDRTCEHWEVSPLHK